jgi:DNA polymerase III delta subunit
MQRGDLRRALWVCGDQPVLVQEILDTIRAHLGVSELDYACLTAGVDPDPCIWAAVLSFSLTPGAARLIVVRDAEKITTWTPLATFVMAGRQLPASYVVFVSGLPDLPDLPDLPGAGEPVPHLELLKAKGRVVRCAAPNEADAIAWAQRRCPSLTPRAAAHLIARTGGDLVAAAGACVKLALFSGVPGTAIIDAVVEAVPVECVTDLLLARRKPEALAAVSDVAERDYLKTVALLETRLELLGSLWHAVRAGLGPREVTGHPPFLVHRYLRHAKHYDPGHCAHAHKVLLLIDDAVRAGARTGVLESLIALW